MRSSNSRKKKRKSLNKKAEAEAEAEYLLSKGYVEDRISSTSSRSSTTGVTFFENGRHSTSNLTAKYAYKNATVDAKFDSNSNLSATIGFHGNFSPSTKTIATLKLPDFSSSKLKFQYFHKQNALVTSFVLSQSPSFRLSATIGNPAIAFRMKAVCKAGSGFTKFDAGIYAAKPNCNASIILADKCDLLKASYVHRFQQLMMNSMKAKFTRRFSTNEDTFTVAGSCKVDRMTTLKVRVNNHGKLDTLLLHKIKRKFSISISGEFNTKDLFKVPRIGLALTLML